ncbi:MAG: delta-60 repeat domain-containing protein [Pseudobacter sp.]|uniref:delta-60 repeat domain-containing protein n=1 Tax=Pseudobacter sp. TaxID=2045420 RepID=UPI003F81DDD3
MKAFYLLLLALSPGLGAACQDLRRDSTFNKNDTTANTSTRCIAVQADGSILFFGDNTFYNGLWPHGDGIPIRYGGRLKPDGTWDDSFTPITVDGRIDDVEIQGFDQKILIAGSFTKVNGVRRGGVARLNTDGTLDESFNTGSGISNSLATLRAWCIEVKEPKGTEPGKIFVGGDFQQYEGRNTGSVIRLNMDGSLDRFYQPKVVEYGVVYDMVYDKINDNLYIGGEFFKVDGVEICRLAKLNPDGSLDTRYRIGPSTYNRPHNSVTSLFLSADNKLLAGGYFDKVNNITRRGLARFNLDGTLDMGFNSGAGFQGPGSSSDLPGLEVRSILVMATGSVIAAGNFTSFNGLPCGNIVKIDVNGSVDPSTTFGLGFNDVVMDLKIQKQPSGEERILAGGFFKTYRKEYQGAIMRLVPEYVLAGNVVRAIARPENKGALIRWSTNISDVSAEVSIERSLDGINYNGIYKAALGSFGKTVGMYYYKDAVLPGNTTYYRVRISQNGGTVYSNIERVGIAGTDMPVVTVFPNPVSSILSVKSVFARSASLNVELYDAKGALLRSWPHSISAGVQIGQFSMPPVADQQVFVRVTDHLGRILLVSKLSYVK